jgi:prolipoprotein diacylglyceryl transferase
MKDNIIHWNVDPEIFWITDSFPLRYYGLLWVIGLILSYLIVQRIYKKENVPLENWEELTMYIFVGALLGARFGHCFFYEPDYYFSHPLEILLPIREVSGSFQFTGFQGLASHGGTLGIIIAILYYWKKTKSNLIWILDRVAISAGVGSAFIRIGNLMNSEVYGKPTDGTWGFIFERDDMIPRHPTQLYEAVSYLLIFALLWYMYHSKKIENRPGLFVGTLLILLFSARFVIEFFKENQVGFEDGMAINMGQWLSIPFILVGLLLVFWKNSPLLKLSSNE